MGKIVPAYVSGHFLTRLDKTKERRAASNLSTQRGMTFGHFLLVKDLKITIEIEFLRTLIIDGEIGLKENRRYWR